jgi:4a-hydroxytetrahydrobiopterin dehydratase
MTETLAEKRCTPCRGGVPPLTHDEAQRLRAQAPNWELADDAHRIERTFRFCNFRESLAFVQEATRSLGSRKCYQARPPLGIKWN